MVKTGAVLVNDGKTFHLGMSVLFEFRNSFPNALDSICARVGFRYLGSEYMVFQWSRKTRICRSREMSGRGTNLFRSREDPTTITEDTLIAKDPIQGRSTIPKGMNNPAAIGIPSRL